ncbi:MAG TPA: hypothetical protein VGR28_03890 [Candidatus Thermoplasmatota archaeon]|jgi:hypothetical protein|nr:hypothetical protein [Candidatus Thermoplasmatota archaeon]
MRSESAVAVAGALLLAGCLGAGNQALAPNTSLTVPVLGDPLILDHDHSDPLLHQLSTPNLRELAHLAWDSVLLGKFPAQAYGEADVEGDIAYVAALVSGFAIVDASDAASPKTLSFTPIPPVYVADIKAAEEGNLVILGTQRTIGRLTSALGVPPPPLPVGVPSAAPIGAIGLQAWDATDKSAPQLVGYLYVDGGCHMVSVLDYDDGTYVFCAPNDNTVRIFRVNHQGPAVLFEPVGLWSPGDLSQVVAYKAAPTGGQFTHDMTVQLDPLTGDPVMFVSFWDLGVHVVDVKDPANPTEVGSWAGEDATLWDGKTHSAMATLIAGKRVLVEIPEYASVPAVFILDATDYGNLRLLAEWTAHPDGDFGENPTLFSTHNFQLVGSKVYLAMYHGGVWVLDLATPSAPKAVAYYLPGAGEVQADIVGGVVPDTWDVVVANGHMFVVDIPTGLYVLHLDGDPADAAYDSFA